MSFSSKYAQDQYHSKYSHTLPSGRKEVWNETAERVVKSVVGPYLPKLVSPILKLVEQKKFMPGGRYLNAAGREYAQICNCFLFMAEDSREGWAELQYKATSALMTGGGIGVVYSHLRPEGYVIKRTGGFSTGPLALMNIINESGRYIMQGGSRRSAIWAGLHWNHPDVFKFIHMKEWSGDVQEMKRRDFNFHAPMEGTNISVILDDDFFDAYRNPFWRKRCRLGDNAYDVDHKWAFKVYWESVKNARVRGEPGFSIDVGKHAGQHLRNACTEVASGDDSDMCNLGSLNLARFESFDEYAEAIDLCTAFLWCGTLYSKLPVENMYKVRDKNRRLGLGIMGLHEWMLKRGYQYGPSLELHKWMDEFAKSGYYADKYSDVYGITRSVATRSIAPTGTISIVAETTSGIEPITSVAYKRRYLKHHSTYAQYVVDPTAHRLIKQGVDPALIEDAMTLANDVPRRLKTQSWLQKFVDHGISSTINLPPFDPEATGANAEIVKFGNQLMEEIPNLRGITAYPDGSRGGQPFTAVPYEEAVSKVGVEFLDQSEQNCRGGFCNS